MPIESKRQASRGGTAIGATEGDGGGAVEPCRLRHYRQHAWIADVINTSAGGRGQHGNEFLEMAKGNAFLNFFG